jgi:mannose-6-phosphate isomerase-like protein (cupin superfamily)
MGRDISCSTTQEIKLVNAEQPMSWPTVVPLTERLGSTAGDGVHWTLEGEGDLNVNLVHLEPGSSIGTHCNHDVDVVLIVVEGSGKVRCDGLDQALADKVLAVIPKGVERSIRAGPDGLSYLTVHRRRDSLGITRRQE